MRVQYRTILNADIVHIRRPDGQSLDAFMHADARNVDGWVAFALVFNPTTGSLTQRVSFPLYYAGLTNTAVVTRDDGNTVSMPIARDYSLAINVTLAAQSVTYFTFRAPAGADSTIVPV